MIEKAEAGTSLEGLLLAAGSGRRTPPVERWDPKLCGAIDIRIAADGVWYHEGRAIHRTRLSKLFSSLLRKDDDDVTYLVTPQEKLAIEVDDAPLIVVDHTAQPSRAGDILVMRTSMGDVVEVGEAHPIRFAAELGSDGLKPYVLVRGRIEALVNRATTQALINDERFVDLTGQVPVLRSGGHRFDITAQDRLPAVANDLA